MRTLRKTLNRFSSFVSSGAEGFLLHSLQPHTDKDIHLTTLHEDAVLIDGQGGGGGGGGGVNVSVGGPQWTPLSKAIYQLTIPSTIQKSKFTGTTVFYQVFDEVRMAVVRVKGLILSYLPISPFLHLFTSPHPPSIYYLVQSNPTQPNQNHKQKSKIAVYRRYKHFEWLHQMLKQKFSSLCLPPLPDKTGSSRFLPESIESRQRSLERYIQRLARHPVVRDSELFRLFVSCTDDAAWKMGKRNALQDPIKGEQFLQTVAVRNSDVCEDGYVSPRSRLWANLTNRVSLSCRR